jgi:orotidine-5'-phosphate decarboxylase
MVNNDFKVFLDLKMHDIPTTVRKAARVVGAYGATYLTLHAFGGSVMLRAGVDGLAEGAAAAGLPSPLAVAVTILTSDSGAPAHILGRRVSTAVEGGCGGIVCAATDVREAKELAPRMIAVVPGIRLAQAEHHDQARAATPREAVAAGADLLVVGRTVTDADDPEAAAIALTEAVAAASS